MIILVSWRNDCEDEKAFNNHGVLEDKGDDAEVRFDFNRLIN